MQSLPNIVLVHGAWADGSCWSSVIEQLQRDGYSVMAPQFPLTTLDDNVARLRQVLADQPGPTLVAAHSYGCQIITALGTDAPNVIGLVYIAGFGLDEGEAIQDLISQASPTPATAHLHVDAKGFAWLTQEDFVNHFAPDVDRVRANVMYAVQQPIPLSAYGEKMGTPAWKTLPTWFMVAQEDQVIPPDGERAFAKRMGAITEEVKSSHVIMVSHPDRVISTIEKAAQTVPVMPVTGKPRTK
jgi:pimeloyl-ACP methyl ester carboxylesterase